MTASPNASSKVNIIAKNVGIETRQEDEKETFSQDDLELQWLAMCNRMPASLVGISSRMKNMNPVITEFPKVEVVVGNELIRQDVEKIRGSIVSTLKMYLHNSDISLNVRVEEHQELVKLLTRREQFEKMSKANPSLAKLCEVFDLELA